MGRYTAYVSTQSWGPFVGVVPQHGSRGRPMRSYTLVDPLGAQAVCRLELLPRCSGQDILGKFNR
jgi:hypothetical protein